MKKVIFSIFLFAGIAVSGYGQTTNDTLIYNPSKNEVGINIMPFVNSLAQTNNFYSGPFQIQYKRKVFGRTSIRSSFVYTNNKERVWTQSGNSDYDTVTMYISNETIIDYSYSIGIQNTYPLGEANFIIGVDFLFGHGYRSKIIDNYEFYLSDNNGFHNQLIDVFEHYDYRKKGVSPLLGVSYYFTSKFSMILQTGCNIIGETRLGESSEGKFTYAEMRPLEIYLNFLF